MTPGTGDDADAVGRFPAVTAADGRAASTTAARTAVERVLDADLHDLTRAGGLPVLPALPDRWRLSDESRRALASHGLPPAREDGLLGVVGAFQDSAEPVPGPDGTAVYVLARYGTATIVAVEGHGRVFALPGQREVRPDLAVSHPSGIGPSFVNSSADRLVECAWRWHWILPLLAEEQRRAGEAEVRASRGGLPQTVDPYAGYDELCRRVLERFTALDSGVGTAAGLWPETIVDVW